MPADLTGAAAVRFLIPGGPMLRREEVQDRQNWHMVGFWGGLVQGQEMDFNDSCESPTTHSRYSMIP